MKFKIIIGFLFVVFLNLSLYAQSSSNIRPVNIGEKLPDLPVIVHVGDSVRHSYIHDFKGKRLLFCYWGIHCTSCLIEMPKMLQLQNQFKDKLQVVYFTDDKYSDIKQELMKSKWLTAKILDAERHITMIYDDTQLIRLFPSASYGLQLWIDETQVLRARSTEPANANNLQAFLSNNKINLPNYFYPDLYDAKKWLSNRIGFQDHLITYSILTKFDEKFGISGQVVIEKDSLSLKITGLNAINKSILELYRTAFGLGNRFRQPLLLETNDSVKYVEDSTQNIIEWERNHKFCYAIKLIPEDSTNIYVKMQTDLDIFFHLRSKMETRNIKCWVLKQTASKDISSTRGLEPEFETISDGYDHYKLVVHNYPISDFFCTQIAGTYLPENEIGFCPIINETRYKGNIDLELPITSSIPLLKKSLKTFGLDLVEEYRPMLVLVLKEKSYRGHEIGKLNN